MAEFCIPIVLAEKLKAAAKRGEIDIAKMYVMSTAERNALFQKYVDPETARAINTRFEKAMVSSQQTALKKWAQEVFVGSEAKKKQYKDVVDKINELSEAGLLSPESERAFLSDLVAEKLGATVTVDEAQKIVELSKKLEQTATTETEFGTPSIEYFKAKREMDDYIKSITPSPVLKVASSIIARGNMLTRLSSPILNIESNTIQAGLMALTRRLESRRVGGINNDYAVKYAKFANEVYKETGYDVTRMLTLQGDRIIRGEDIVTAQGPGTVREVARWYEDKIFEKTQGAPDVFFSSIAFSDRANIESTKLAGGSKEKALEIFKDATRIDPKTKEGQAVRESALADAFYSTYTNKSVYGDIGLGIRKVFNIASGNLRLGDQMMPFVKTPANVIGAGIDMSGIGMPVELLTDLISTVNDVRNGTGFTEAAADNFKGFGRQAIMAGLGLTISYVLASQFKPEDFIGEFPVTEKERQLLTLKNATTNSVRIGNRWVSLDYFGALGAPMVGHLYAAKYGKTLPDKVFYYVKGVIRQSAKIPGFDAAYSALKAIQEATPSAKKTLDKEMKDVANYLIGFMQSRSTPGILYDLAKMTDSKERATDKEDILSKLKSAIPGLRQTLPEKRTIFAESISTEPWYSTLFAGSRIKTASDDALVEELSILDKTGNLPSITDVAKTSERAKALEQQIGADKFEEAMIYFGTNLKAQMTKEISRNSYKRLPEEKKKTQLDNIKNDLFEKTLRKYHYKKTKTERQETKRE